MAEVENGFDSSFRYTVYYPLQILQLQVGDADMLHDAFITQFYQSRKCFVNDLVEVGKLYIVDVDQVDLFDMQPFHTFIDAFGSPAGRVIPDVHSVFPVTAYFGGEQIGFTRDLLQSFS